MKIELYLNVKSQIGKNNNLTNNKEFWQNSTNVTFLSSFFLYSVLEAKLNNSNLSILILVIHNIKIVLLNYLSNYKNKRELMNVLHFIFIVNSFLTYK